MKIIHKYEMIAIEPGSLTDKSFDWPEGARVVHVDSQSPGTVQLWVEIDNQYQRDSPVLEDRTFKVYGTGHHIEDRDFYVGTAIDEVFVWHVYERT